MVKELETNKEEVSNGISISLRFLGIAIFLLPVLMLFPLLIMNRFVSCSSNSAYECVNILSGNAAILAN